MQHDNPANQANFDEMQAHLQAVAAKLKTAAGEQRELLLADQSDYYERAIQLQKMAKDTFMLQRNEAEAHCRKLAKRNARLLVLLLFVCALVFIGLLESIAPGTLRALGANVTGAQAASYFAAVITGAAACSVLSHHPKQD